MRQFKWPFTWRKWRAGSPLFDFCYLVIMGAMASQINGVSSVYSTVCSGADQWKHHSSVPPVFVRGIHRWPSNSHTKASDAELWCFHFMTSLWKKVFLSTCTFWYYVFQSNFEGVFSWIGFQADHLCYTCIKELSSTDKSSVTCLHFGKTRMQYIKVKVKEAHSRFLSMC